jgi:hypothetical protein
VRVRYYARYSLLHNHRKSDFAQAVFPIGIVLLQNNGLWNLDGQVCLQAIELENELLSANHVFYCLELVVDRHVILGRKLFYRLHKLLVVVTLLNRSTVLAHNVGVLDFVRYCTKVIY